MATTYFTNATVSITDPVQAWSYLEAPPVCWPVIATDMNLDPDTEIDGRYVDGSTGQIEGINEPKMQPTTLSSGLNTGRTFTVTTGTWFDNYVNTVTNQNELLMPDSTSATAFDIHTTNITAKIEPVDLVLWRGIPGPGATRSQSNYTCYIELAHGSSDNTNYRIAMEWGQPIRIDYSQDNGATWGAGPRAIARSLGSLESFLAACNYKVRFRVRTDESNGSMTIEVNDGNFLYVKSPTGELPKPGNIRINGLNGSLSLGYLPLRAQPITVKGSIDIGQTQPNAGNAFVQHNSLGYPPDSQTTSSTVSSDDNQNFDYTTTAETPDSGDGLGSLDTPILANITLVIPAVWVDQLSTLPPVIGGQGLPNRIVDELQLFDDATRCATSSAHINVDNQYGRFNGALSHQACSIYASVGGSYYPRFFGIAGESPEGIDLSTIQTWSRMGLPCQGREAAMNKAPALRRLYDGWCLFSAVRFECELGNIHPRFQQSFPLYVPPGATANAPYGEAGADCPFPILAKGSGLNARYDFGPEVPPWQVLQILAQENGAIDPSSGLSIPYYMGFQLDGQFHFEPYDPSTKTPVISYSDIDHTGIGQIDGELHVYNSIAQLRSDIDFQGIDPFTYELLVGHITQPDVIKQAIGYRYPWLERNARYSGQYLQQMMEVAARIAARPQQVLKFKVPFQPYVNAGDVCFVQSQKSLGGSGFYVIIELMSRYGMASAYGNSGIRESYSIVTCRNMLEYPRGSFLM